MKWGWRDHEVNAMTVKEYLKKLRDLRKYDLIRDIIDAYDKIDPIACDIYKWRETYKNTPKGTFKYITKMINKDYDTDFHVDTIRYKYKHACEVIQRIRKSREKTQ